MRKWNPNKTGEWGSMCCESDYDHKALRSWFPMIPDEWRPILADCWEDFETSTTPRLRVLFQRPDGQLRLAERRRNKRSTILKIAAPSPSLLKQWSRDHRLACFEAEGR